jgi:uncharacterized repeat protein (TIGR01451 family)
MKRNLSEAVVRRVSVAWRWASALFAAVAMTVGVAPAHAADASFLVLNVTQSPNPAIYGASATYAVTLKNTSNKTVNNAGVTVTAPAGSMFVAPGPSCALSTALPCATPSGSPTSFAASGYQLPSKGSLTITVGYYMPAAASPPASFVLNVTGTSSNNTTGPGQAAFTTVSTAYATVFAPPPPSYPSIETTIGHDSGNTVLWSTAACDSSNLPDCGATYYAQYLITVKNAGSTDLPSTRPLNVTLTGGAAAFTDAFDCSAPCSQSGNVFTVAGLATGASTSFTVFFKSPLNPANIDVTATVSIDNPAVVLPAPATVSLQTVPTDAAIQTYSSLVPTTGGSAKAKNSLDPSGAHPFTGRVDVPKYNKGDFSKPINIVINETPGTIACSPSSPQCLDTKVDVQSNGTPVTFGGTLNGTDFLVITMYRDWTTLAKKPSSVFNATVWYTDDAGNRTVIKDCANVDLTLADRCVYQRIDMTTSAKGVITGGYLKFIIWARHNGVHSW